MQFEWLGIAEGATEDARGALALVGVEQNVVLASGLPAATRRVLIARITDDDDMLTAGTPIEISLRVESPTGKIVTANTQTIEAGAKKYEEIPGALQFAAEVSFQITEFGTFNVFCEIEAAGETITTRKPLYVLHRANSQ